MEETSLFHTLRSSGGWVRNGTKSIPENIPESIAEIATENIACAVAENIPVSIAGITIEKIVCAVAENIPESIAVIVTENIACAITENIPESIAGITIEKIVWGDLDSCAKENNSDQFIYAEQPGKSIPALRGVGTGARRVLD